jgi:hypothetical protein
MRVRGSNHAGGRRRAARPLALFVAAAALAAQFSSAWHELAVRHVRCAEHGELTHVAPLQGASPAPASDVRAVDALPPATPDGHEHCAVLFTIQGSAQAPVVRTPVAFAPPVPVARAATDVAPRPGRAFVLASAPKTSPPSA